MDASKYVLSHSTNLKTEGNNYFLKFPKLDQLEFLFLPFRCCIYLIFIKHKISLIFFPNASSDFVNFGKTKKVLNSFPLPAQFQDSVHLDKMSQV